MKIVDKSPCSDTNQPNNQNSLKLLQYQGDLIYCSTPNCPSYLPKAVHPIYLVILGKKVSHKFKVVYRAITVVTTTRFSGMVTIQYCPSVVN